MQRLTPARTLSRPWAVPVVLVWLLVFAGCGGSDGPPVYQVSGTVTFAGKPVPAGSVLFEPDTEKGNRGPAGYATIREGKYDTRDGGKGTIGGPHLVRVSGAERAVPEGTPVEEVRIQPLFPEFVTAIDLPPQDATQDLLVAPKH